MRYVDGFLLAVPKKNLKAYKTMSTKAGKVWMEHGALQYVETVGDDLKTKMCASFLDTVKPKKGETVVFSFIVYKSRAHRDQVNKKVMTDPRLAKICDMNKMPFDLSRMVYGGFSMLVDM
jgi:uncharacterized protein YbaA (DUF1428 family)